MSAGWTAVCRPVYDGTDFQKTGDSCYSSGRSCTWALAFALYWWDGRLAAFANMWTMLLTMTTAFGLCGGRRANAPL